MKRTRGFTLTQLLLTIALTATISSIAFPYVAGGPAHLDTAIQGHVSPTAPASALLTDDDYNYIYARMDEARRRHGRFNALKYEDRVIDRRRIELFSSE